MFKNCYLAYLALLICAQTLSSASSHSSIVELDNHDPAIHHINIECPNDPNFLACRLSIDWQILEMSTNENFHTLVNPIAASTELLKHPGLPTSLTLYSPSVDPLEIWLKKQAGSVEFMDYVSKFDPTTQPASKGIFIQAVVFQRTILLPNFR